MAMYFIVFIIVTQNILQAVHSDVLSHTDVYAHVYKSL